MTRRKNPTVRLVGFGKPRAISPAVEAFLRDLFDASYPLPFKNASRTERVLTGIEAVVEVTPQYAGIHVDEVRALTQKQGEGTKAMRFLTDLADKHGVELYLYAKPFGNEAMDLDNLVRFYRRHGFREMEEEDEDGEGTEMMRWPRTPVRSNPARKPSQTDTVTSSAAFQRWFGASKVVDAKRKPLVVYHAGFDVVRSPEGAFRLSESGKAGSGIYFTPSFSEAERYLGRAHEMHHEAVKIAKYDGLPIPPPPAVTAVYLSVQKPAVVVRHGKDEPSETLARKVFPKGVSWEDEDYEPAALLRHTRAAGYDGVFVVNGKREVEEIVVFDPTQVKSAMDNAGTFDPADPSILRNPASRNPASRNPARKPSQTDTVTSSAAFRRWFGASKVVDERGKPLVVYHGTERGGFDTFRASEFHVGFFFSDSPSVAWTYSRAGTRQKVLTRSRLRTMNVADEVPALYKAYLQMESPLVVDAAGDDWSSISVYRLPDDLRDPVREAVNDAYASTLSTNELLEAASLLGFDGIIVKRVWDLAGDTRRGADLSTIYAVFDPTQVKSANMNAGTFDPADPSILRNPNPRSRIVRHKVPR